MSTDTGSVQLIGANNTPVTVNETSFTPFLNVTHGYQLPQAQMINMGPVISIAASGDDAGLYVPTSSPLSNTAFFTNFTNGTILAEADASGATAYAIFYGSSGPMISNQGLIQSVSQGTAYGVLSYSDDSGVFFNQPSGTLNVWGRDDAVGISLVNGGTVDNEGLIEIAGGQNATGVSGADTFYNYGTLNVTSLGGNPGIAVDASHGMSIENSGTITADQAVYADPSSYADVSIDNSGTITGDIVLANGISGIHNTGTIGGNIYFGDGVATYDGALGHLYGDIHLGDASNHVTLGDDGNTVYGGGSSDIINGGAGDDMFMIAGGNNLVMGWGGYNTLSFQSATTGYTIYVGGEAIGDGTTDFSNIQRVIGSSFADTIIGGASASMMVAGGGADTLLGGAAAETLVAGPGGDSLSGGGGDDTFVYSAGDGQVVITDFRASGDQDVLKIYGYGSAVSTQQQGADTLITLSGGDSILLKNISVAALSGALVYTTSSYSLPPPPAPLPVIGDQPVKLDHSLTLNAGDHLVMDFGASSEANAGIELTTSQGLSYADAYHTAFSFDNFGTASFTGSGGAVYGASGAAQNGPATPTTFTNEAGANFSVVNHDGEAAGLYWGFSRIVNDGTFSVSASGASQQVNGGYVTQADFTNAAGATFTVHSDNSGAAGLSVQQGGTIRNDGSIDVSGTGTVYGIYNDGFGNVGSQFTNNGTIHATSASGTAIGIAILGRDDLPNWPVNALVNTGLISAQIAIENLARSWSDDTSSSIALTNSGTIDGDIDLTGSRTTITNAGGTINGNILLRDDNGFPGQRAAGVHGGDTVDLRGGNFSGNITISAGQAGDVNDHYAIYTGAATTTVEFTGGQSLMTADVRADQGGHVTVEYDMASGGAHWSRNADGSVTVSAGDHGTETLMNVEALQFTDGVVALDSSFHGLPVVTTTDVSQLHGRTLALSSLFMVNNSSAITRYELWDSTRDPNSGHFVVNGIAQASGAVIDITASQLAQTSFVTGNIGDSLQIRAFDGANWSAADNAAWSPFNVAVYGDAPPVVNTFNRIMTGGETQPLSNLFGVSDYENDSMTKYELWDATRDPNGGYFTINGQRQAAGTVIDVTAAQLAQTSFVMGTVTTSLQMRAFDGLAWSAADDAAWAPFTVSLPGDHPPSLTTSNISATPGQTLTLSNMFSVSDADGDTMTRYELWDSTRDPNSGHFVVGGVVQAGGTVIDITAAQLSQTSFLAGRLDDNLQIRAFDGLAWSAADDAAWASFIVSIPSNHAPVVTTSNKTEPHGATLALSSLFSVSDADGDSMTKYELWDATRDSSSGHFVVNGVVQAAGTVIDIAAAQLSQTSFVTGAIGDSLQIRAFDGLDWSAGDTATWSPFTISIPPNSAPVLTTTDKNMTAGQTLALSSLFSVSDADGDTMAQYELWDSSRDPNSGHFVVGGVAQAAGAVIDVTAAQLSQTSFLTGTVGDALQVRAFDGYAWSAGDTAAWAPFHISV